MAYAVTLKPLAERRAIIQESQAASSDFGPEIVNFRDGTCKTKSVTLPIDLPAYRMASCHAFSMQQAAIAQQSLPNNYFETGQESTEVQQTQHELLTRLAQQGSGGIASAATVVNEDGRCKPLLITSDGVVVSGNRRLAAMRECRQLADGATDERFSHVECAVLPPDTTPDEVDDIVDNFINACESAVERNKGQRNEQTGSAPRSGGPAQRAGTHADIARADTFKPTRNSPSTLKIVFDFFMWIATIWRSASDSAPGSDSDSDSGDGDGDGD